MHRALLVMVGDESAAVSTAAYKLLCQIGAQYLKSWEESQKAEDEETTGYSRYTLADRRE